jgi:hypothetical protein
MRSILGVYMMLVVAILDGGCLRKPQASMPGTQNQALFHAKPLTTQDLNRKDDQVVDEAIRDRMWTLFYSGTDNSEAPERLNSNGLKIVHATSIVEDEVANGGFNQYFWNTDGKYADEAVKGYKALGANKHADLVARAIKIWQSEKAQQDAYKAEGTKEAFSKSYKDTKLNGLDQPFYKLESAENTVKLRVKYARSHPDDFVGR